MPERPTSAEQAVLSLISADELVELTRALVGAPGENPPGQEAATVAVLADACAARGLDPVLTVVEPDRPNLSASVSGGPGPGLLLLGHTDVVPAGGGWAVDALGGPVRDGRVSGRGSADMKGGLAACVAAMSALRRAGADLTGPVELAAVVDEEETGKGVRHYLRERDRSPLAGCVVAEPTDLRTVIAARGDCYLELLVHGRAAHAGNPAEGVNAIYGAAAVIATLERWHAELAEHAHPLVGPATWSVGLVEGGTGASVVPAECRVVADRRLLPGETGADVLEEVRRRLTGSGPGPGLGLGLEPGGGPDVDVALVMEMPGFETAAGHPFVVAVDAALAAAGGPGLPMGGWTAACDGGFVDRDAGVPVVVLGPGSVETQAHRADESVAVDDLVVAARAYALTAMRLLG